MDYQFVGALPASADYHILRAGTLYPGFDRAARLVLSRHRQPDGGRLVAFHGARPAGRNLWADVG